MNRKFYVILLAPFASACATIDQAPLVYVSALKVGVTAATGTADSPGAKVLIGFESTDAAFVPVQVARRCQVVVGVDCKKGDYPILDVRGSSTLDPHELFLRARSAAEALDTARNTYSDKVKLFDAAAKEERDALDSLRQLGTDNAIIAGWEARADAAAPVVAADGTQAAAPAETPEVANARTDAAKRSDAKGIAERATTKRENAAAEVDRAADALAGAQVKLNAMLAENPKVADTKNDALSVYGSFNGDASAGVGGGNAPSASLKLGKTFSTGVAAQQLTQGIQEAAVKSASPQATCIASAGTTASILQDGTARAAALTAALKGCESVH